MTGAGGTWSTTRLRTRDRVLPLSPGLLVV